MHACMHLIDNAYACNLMHDKIMVGSTDLVIVSVLWFCDSALVLLFHVSSLYLNSSDSF
jgi:hypothetical protein